MGRYDYSSVVDGGTPPAYPLPSPLAHYMEFSPYDLAMVVVLLVGVMRGRKRGMSEELLDVVEWIVIVFACAFLYRPLSNVLGGTANLPIFWSDVLSYLLILCIVMLLFKSLKRAVGEKLVQGDTFGRFEYYLGMMAGALRFFCVVLVILSILHAKYYSPAEIAANAKMQQENFGSISFPTIASLQNDIFRKSISGKFIAKTLKPLLIRPVAEGPSGRENVYKRRGREVEDVMK
jgi:uncharacterized membrane protein required for colicin V production